MKQDVPFLLESDYGPAGDQPHAIRELVKGIEEKKKHPLQRKLHRLVTS